MIRRKILQALLLSVVSLASCSTYRISSSLGTKSAQLRSSESEYGMIIERLEQKISRAKAFSEKAPLDFELFPKEGLSIQEEKREIIYGSLGPFRTGELITSVVKRSGPILLIRISRKDGEPFLSKGSLQVRHQGIEGKVLERREIVPGEAFIDIGVILPNISFSALYPVVILSGDAINTRLLSPPVFVGTRFISWIN